MSTTTNVHDIHTFECPRCGAKRGHVCVSKDGKNPLSGVRTIHYQRSRAAKLAGDIIKRARQWCGEAETAEAYEQLKGTESTSAPGAFMVLYEAVEEFEKLMKGDGDEANHTA